MTSRRSLCIGIALTSLCLARSSLSAAPLQLQGELTITNTTDQLSPASSLFSLPGGTLDLRFSLSGHSEEVPFDTLAGGQLAAEFWPDPGESHTGPLLIDFLTPGAGVIEQGPLRVDGLLLTFSVRGPHDSSGGVPMLEIGTPLDFPIVAFRRAGGTQIGSGTFRVDAIVPEPLSMALFLTSFVLAVAARPARRALTKRGKVTGWHQRGCAERGCTIRA